MPKRQKLRKAKSRRLFTKTAKIRHKRNTPKRRPMRGGYRI